MIFIYLHVYIVNPFGMFETRPAMDISGCASALSLRPLLELCIGGCL